MGIKQRFNKIWKDPVWSKVIGAGIIFLITWTAGGLPWVWKLVKTLFAWLGSSITIPIWIFILLVTCSSILIIVFIYALLPKKERSEPIEISYKDYTFDHFFGFLWEWDWNPFDGQIYIQCLCPKCKYELELRDQYLAYKTKCPNCSLEINIPYENSYNLEQKVKKQIHRVIRTGEWKKKVEQQIKAFKE